LGKDPIRDGYFTKRLNVEAGLFSLVFTALVPCCCKAVDQQILRSRVLSAKMFVLLAAYPDFVKNAVVESKNFPRDVTGFRNEKASFSY